MPVTGSLVSLNLKYTFLGEQCETLQWYRPSGVAFATATLLGVAEAWWDAVSAAWRALVTNDGDIFQFDSIDAYEFDGDGAVATYAIPGGDRDGTRSPATSGEYMPPYVVSRVRQTVGFATTRSGQKRLSGLYEADVYQNIVQNTYKALLDDVMEFYSAPIDLPSPLLTGLLIPVVAHREGNPLLPTVWQDVVGYIINPLAGTQTSRRPR